ncbi:nitronate monooxygenase [Desulfosarcina widdelii]|uniref:Nitronate monooxygenase n=1 Tax=Desulfosarcina widdelii TaxID=947919 RepID=A0A5K7Z1C1_9BACT|nr:nitronate monooxygenase family protein [Desulfosarcina widdelii]BBO74505.1 nitronate monooxygenase [Desulfosarcina widdelii]
MWETRVTKLLGIELPIIGGAMQWLSRAELAAAVSNAGGLGIITSATFASKEDLRAEIRKVRELTDKPFAININLFPSLRPFSVEDMLDAIDDEGVTIVETAGNSPEKYLERLKRGGRIHMHKCARRKDAVKAEKMGVDMLTIVGTECGGHPSAEGVTTMVLLPQTIDSVSIPVVAGGGFTDGRALMAAFAMGAEGIVIGTALMATTECPIHESFKKALIAADETSTCLLLNSVKKPVRAFNNRTAQEVLELETACAPLEDILPKMKGERGLEAYRKGDLDGGVWACGQAAGLVKQSLPVAEYFRKIMDQAESIRCRWAKSE